MREISYEISSKSFFSLVLFSFSCSSPEIFQGNDREWTTKDITQNRDIKQYDQGGHFWCRWRPYGNEEDRLNGEKKVRDFIWQHSIEKKRGYIKLSCGGIDTSSTTHYFIEPNEKGELNVVRRLISRQSDDRFIRKDEELSVERVENERDKSNWSLVYKSKDGEVVDKEPVF